MKIERDKIYLTRSGDKVRCVCVDAPGDYPVIVVPYNNPQDGWDPELYKKNGIWYSGDSSDQDLVSELKEPREWRVCIDKEKHIDSRHYCTRFGHQTCQCIVVREAIDE